MHLFQLVVRFVPPKVIRVRNKDKPWFDDDSRLALDIQQGAHFRWNHLTRMSLSITRAGPMQYMPRLCVSLVSATGMF